MYIIYFILNICFFGVKIGPWQKLPKNDSKMNQKWVKNDSKRPKNDSKTTQKRPKKNPKAMHNRLWGYDRFLG